MTTTAALRSYNQKSKASSSDTPAEEESSSITTPTEEESRSSIIQPEEESSDSSIYFNENRSSYVPKRKQEEDKEITATPTKRPNQQQTLKLIALTNVMLLTPSQFSRYARSHFNDEVLNEWYKSILSTLIVDVEKEARDISRSLDDNLQKKRIKTRDAIQKLVAMSVGKEDYEAQILIGLANL
ncbi:hypothetical protein K501DRAFT_173070 [Backusella circina FSU 941]|nr:hypothetical protein K501DRAFT_173070 [Backusella circina FSU 941]